MKQVRKIIESIVKQRLAEARPSEDPIIADCAGALSHALVEALEGDLIGDNAFEVMMGSAPDEDRLVLGRYEDLDAVAEVVVRDVLRDANVHDALYQIAESMLRAAMQVAHEDRGVPSKLRGR